MRTEETRRKLADAAALELLENGYAGSSLSAIAARIGLTKGAYAYHFRAKSDVAAAFLKLAAAGSEQAAAYAREAYPDCGVRRLVLHFLMLSRWRYTEPQFAAGVALFADRASPIFESAEIMEGWKDQVTQAFLLADRSGDRDARFTPGEAAEFFLVSMLGAVVRHYTEPPDPRTSGLPLLRQALMGCGVTRADTFVDDVLAAHAAALPRLCYPDSA